MTTTTKVLIGLGLVAGVAGVVWWLRRKKLADPKAFFGEWNLENCGCIYTEQFADGTTKSTKMPMFFCSMLGDEGLKLEIKRCEAKTEVGKDLFFSNP